jgi:calcineurin-like phosphoesterase family protein
MRLVATSDTHFDFPPEFVPDGDVFLHCGDLMYTGYPDEWKGRVESLAALPHKLKILVPGNHDLHIQNYPGPALQDLRRAGVTVIGIEMGVKPYVELPNGMSILGLPWVTNLPRWAWHRTEAQIEELLALHNRHKIVASHSPPAGILDGQNYGVKAYRRWQHRFRPDYWFCGHIHECHGEDAKDGTQFFNVAAQNRDYTAFANAPTILDL